MQIVARWVAGNIMCLLALGTFGCSLRATTVIDSFSGEFSCAKGQIQLDRPDKSQPNLFRAVGCNRRASYRCTGDYGALCERIGEPEKLSPEAGTIDFPVTNDGKRP